MMTRANLYASILVVGALVACQGAVIEPKFQALKVFNYQGNLPPIKDDRTGEIIRDDDDLIKPENGNQTDDGEICWNLIVDQSGEWTYEKNRLLQNITDQSNNVNL